MRPLLCRRGVAIAGSRYKVSFLLSACAIECACRRDSESESGGSGAGGRTDGVQGGAKLTSAASLSGSMFSAPHASGKGCSGVIFATAAKFIGGRGCESSGCVLVSGGKRERKGRDHAQVP